MLPASSVSTERRRPCRAVRGPAEVQLRRRSAQAEEAVGLEEAAALDREVERRLHPRARGAGDARVAEQRGGLGEQVVAGQRLDAAEDELHRVLQLLAADVGDPSLAR